MNPKKIFFVADAASIHTAKWVDFFVDKNYDVHLATFASNNKTQCQNVYFLSNKSIVVSGGNYHYLLAIPSLARILKEINPDIINAHYSYSMGLISLVAKKMAGVQSQFSVVCHGSDILVPPRPKIIFEWINKYVLHWSDKIFAVSDQIKDEIEKFSIDMNKVFIGQYGVNIAHQSTLKDIDILSNRTYNENSRIDFLLESLEYLKEQKLKIVFVVPTISEDNFRKLSSRYPNIKFYKQIDYSKSIELVNRAKVYISATKSDGTSLSLIEAMKLGCIPVVSNIVSNRSWILDSVNGYLFDTQKQFIEKLQQALKLNEDKMQNLNSDLILKKCDYLIQMEKIEIFLFDTIQEQ